MVQSKSHSVATYESLPQHPSGQEEEGGRGNRGEHKEDGVRGHRGHRGEHKEDGAFDPEVPHVRDPLAVPSKQQPQHQLPEESASLPRVLASSAKPKATGADTNGHGSSVAAGVVVGACVVCALLAAVAGVAVMRRRQLLTPVDGEGGLVAAHLAATARQTTQIAV